MTVTEPSGSPDRRLRIPEVLSRSFVLTALMLSGCTSTTQLSWRDTRTPRDQAALEASLADAGSKAVGLRGKPTPPTPDAESGRTADVGLVRTAAASAEEPGEPVSSTETAARRTELDEPVPLATGYRVPSIPAPDREYPIDLTTALRLAEIENPLIAEARQRIGQALAERQGAMALLLPSLNFGGNYHGHTGNLQRSSGRILALDENSLYLGGGSGVMAASPAEIPAISIISQLTDAIFEPLAARQEIETARFNATATANEILLEVSEHYFELLAAEAILNARLEIAEKEAEVARLTRAYAEAEQGRPADANRAATELSLIVDEIRQAEEEVRVAAAQLTRRLHLDQTVLVRPVAPKMEMTTIIDPMAPLPDLVRAALTGRPEVGETTAAIARAEVKKKEEQYRPLLPTLWLGFSGGVMGGGSNVVPPELSHFGGRTDFDVRIYWTLRNFGVGNISLIKQRQAEINIAVGERSRAITEIRREVASAYAEVSAARLQVGITTRELESAVKGFSEDLTRIQNTVGRPIEAVNSLELLNHARIDRIIAVKNYNQAQFKLFVSLGSPPPLDESAQEPIPPAPIASPPLPPLVAGAAAVPTGAPVRRPLPALAVHAAH